MFSSSFRRFPGPWALILLLFMERPTFSQIPHTLSYQGILADTAGTPIPDGSYNFTFRLYTVASGGSSIWSETKSVQVKQGLFSTILGSLTPIPDSVRFDRQYWLGVQVASDPELTPRIQLTSVGSSFSAQQADLAQTVPDNSLTGGKIGSGQVVKSINGLHDNVTMRGANGASVTTNGDTVTITASGGGGGGIGTIQNTNNTLDIINPGGPTATVNVKVPLSLSGTGSSVFSATNTNANSIGILGRDDQAGAVGVWGQSDANTGVYGQSTNGRGVWGQSTASAGVYGISTNSAGVYGQTSSSGLGAAGVRGLNLATNGIGVQGSATDGVGVEGVSDVGTGVYGLSASGTAILGQASGSSTVGVRGEANSSGGVGVWGQSDANTGVFGLTSSSTGSGIWGQNQSAGAGAIAIRGEITSTNPGASSAAVKGINNGTGGSGIGVWGEQHGSGYGVYGSAPNGDGVYGTGGTGVYGTCSTPGAAVVGHSSASPPNHFGALGYQSGTRDYEVYGNAPNSSAAYAGYFNGTVQIDDFQGDVPPLIVNHNVNNSSAHFYGQVGISGDLVVSGSKNFMIDHPLDPANKYLFHSCIESPDRMNIYNGNIITDASGLATVELPGYFETLNIDYRYQLTVIGQFAQAIVWEKIHNNRFVIKTDRPNIEVSWQVTGIRNDAYAKAHPMVVEKEKDAKDRGKYLMPELFGQPPEMGIGYRPPHNTSVPDGIPSPEKERMKN